MELRRSTKKYDAQKLYSVEIIEREDDRVKVHYVGYSSKYDEWKDKSEFEFSLMSHFLCTKI